MTTLSSLVSKLHSSQINQLTRLSVGKESSVQEDVLGNLMKEVGDVVAAGGAAQALLTETSLPEVTRVANLQPRVLIEDTLATLPNMSKFLMALTNIYTAYYLQAISLSTEISGVNVISFLDKFNPNRKADYSKMMQHIGNRKEFLASPGNKYNSIYKFLAKESYSLVLPNYTKGFSVLSQENEKDIVEKFTALTPEQLAEHKAKYEQDALLAKMKQDANKGLLNVQKATIDANLANKELQGYQAPSKMEIKSGLKQIQDVDNLAVGRLIDVKLSLNGQATNVPVAVRVRPMSVPKLIMKELIALGDIKESWTERWHRMRSGELSFISDWIFQSDIINHRRKLMALDKNGIYKEMLKRRKNNKLAALTSGQVSLGAASAFMVINQNTLREVEVRLGQTLDHAQFRERLFKENSAMMVVVIDTEWERIKTITRGIDGVVDYSFKDFENMGKGDGVNITDIMKAYTMNQSPRF